MKKLRTIKPIPGIPVGSILKKDSCCDRYSGVTPYNYTLEELEGFVEEVKEPEEFWILADNGQVLKPTMIIDESIPKWLRFQTKESAEKFAKELNNSHGTHIDREKHDTQSIWDALNERVK